MRLFLNSPLIGPVTVHVEAASSAGRARGGHASRPSIRRAAPRALAPESVPPADLVFAEEARAAVEARLDDAGFDVGALAEALGVSRSNLYRRLGDCLGQTPQRLIRERRLARAARLLRDRAGRVGEVAYAVGYRSTAHFSRAFRAQFGMSPSSYAARSQTQGSQEANGGILPGEASVYVR